MNQTERIDDLLRAGWHIYKRLARWTVLARKSQDPHLQFNPSGLEFLSVFRNGMTVQGFINDYPKRTAQGFINDYPNWR